MDYYKSGDLLIQYNSETNVYKVRNTIDPTSDKVLTKEYFDSLPKERIKKEKFCELMNIYFKSVKHSWIHDGDTYRKLDNFEQNGHSMCSNYDFTKLPVHQLDKYSPRLLVYHWGRVYYMLWSYGGYPQGCLYDVYTKNFVQWAKPKHCSPVFNERTKKIA